ncbi:MAG: DNA polymerase, partial [Candidatus Paceibacterota bacterium]
MPSYSSSYRRPIPVITPVESLPFPGNVIRLCSDCGLRGGCTAPVPGHGQSPSDIMLVGEAPGYNEDLENIPFIGQAGMYLNSLLFQCGVPRESIYISNVVKCRPPNNRTPKPDEIRTCAKWLDIELGIVQPRIIVAMGATAIYRFLGTGAGTVEHLHGKPVERDGRIVLPCYHPAAALHNTTLLRQCQEDFNVLRGLVKGRDWREYHAVDKFPSPVYQVADTPEKLQQMTNEINEAGLYAVDTETCRGELWSVQISTKPGTAWFVPIKSGYKGRVDLTQYNATAIVHYYLHDVEYLNIADDKFLDTMVLAYLTGQSQGLKELASRLCGVQMQSYSDVVRPGQQKLSIKYLTEASKGDWGDPPPTEETKWDNKKGCLVTKAKKPWHISRKTNKILGDFEANPDTDLWERWKSIPAGERAEVESKLGLMPESSLMDIPFKDAVVYSCRDSDVTLRVYYKLKEQIEQLGLDYVLDMDLKILPMVDAMMRNGMAVDVDHYRKLSADYDVRLRAKTAELAGMVGHPFNPNSSQQVAQVIYTELGFKPTKTTPSGDVSTDDAELKKTGSDVAKGIIRYRGLQKLKSTYADNMIRSAHPDENGVYRVHTVLTTTRVETGRLSSKKDDNGEAVNT